MGYNVDANGLPHGFLRDSRGTFTSFDVPGAVDYSLVYTEGTPGSSLNPNGEATGGYYDANGNQHGFVRDNHGAITTFDAPEAVNGTIPLSINAAGEVTGYYYDASFGVHGFIRDAGGHITDFDTPGAVCEGTVPQGINAGGQIAGESCSGFLRERNGVFTAIDVPSFTEGTSPLAISDGGAIAGFGSDNTGAEHGFIRCPSGSFTVFDIPGVIAFSYMSINSSGVVAGWTYGATDGFRRTSDGTLTSIAPPGAQFTSVNSINAAGVITGAYLDTNSVFHGFLFLPH